MHAHSPQSHPGEGPPSQHTPSPPRPKAGSLANIAVHGFAAFRSQPAQSPTPSPIRRKPLPTDSPVLAPSSPPGAHQRIASLGDRLSLSRNPHRPSASLSQPFGDEGLFVPRNLDSDPHGHTPVTVNPPISYAPPRKSSLSHEYSRFPTPPQSGSRHDRSASGVLRPPPNKANHARSPTMPNMAYPSQHRQPNLKLQLEGVTEDFLDDYPYDSAPESAHPTKPKSPAAGKLSSFFGWNSKPQNDSDSPSTTFSDKSQSPGTSPRHAVKNRPAGLDIPVANSLAQPSYFNVPGTPLLSHSPQMNAHVEELERELREVSSELANSIRRELELEDEVERWKAESTLSVAGDNRRTSDYYSDSGTSSIRFPISDPEAKLEEVEALRRKAEQERAQLKVNMAERLQEELRRRRDLEEQVQQLEEKVYAQTTPSSASSAERERIRELEVTLEDVKRRLAEEKQVKENFEDLLTALRQDLEQYRNERDNLRDEIVPQLKLRVEGLESEASETQSLIYESTRMQQEIQQLQHEKQELATMQQEMAQRQVDPQALADMQQEIQRLQRENQTLSNERRAQQELVQQQSRFREEAADVPGPLAGRVGLSRSNSLARSSTYNPKRSSMFDPKRGSLSRSSSVKNRSIPESPQEGPPIAGSNPVKELEEQRDALHKALKHLLQRQELQQREFAKRIKELEAERDRALNLTPRRTTFHKEVAQLRDEVNSLRRRADEALEQKWQCEKGLGGLRMDLDRAQQETTSLRELLQEHDIVVPEIRLEDQPISLDKAYNELRTTHALSIAHIKQMEMDDSLGAAGEEAERTLDLLKRSISDAEAERDAAMKDAEEYRQQARALQSSELQHLDTQQQLSRELFAAATRIDELSNRIQIQLQSNRDLRVRLAEAIARGEKEQTKSAEKIIELERRLKSAEDKVMVAQQSSEEAVSRHEEEVQALKESQSSSLRRVRSDLLSPAAFSPKSPVSPFLQRFPRLEQTSSGPAMSFAEATKTELLEKRVEELERALRDADHEMEEVVGRMNMAQIEVADLQFERDEAMKQTRRLQADILAEREKVQSLMASN